MLACPVEGCAWTLDPDTARIIDGHDVVAMFPSSMCNSMDSLRGLPTAVIDEGINAAVRARAERVEAAVRVHAGTHDVVEYLRTIAVLRDLVTRYERAAQVDAPYGATQVARYAP